MKGSYLGGSTIIKVPRNKNWYKRQRLRAETNNEKNNLMIEEQKKNQKITEEWVPEFTLIKKDDHDKR
jgi:hypothetical protein